MQRRGLANVSLRDWKRLAVPVSGFFRCREDANPHANEPGHPPNGLKHVKSFAAGQIDVEQDQARGGTVLALKGRNGPVAVFVGDALVGESRC